MADERHMITFEHGDRRFNMRVVAVILDRDEKRVLIHHTDFEDFWTFPGGRAELGESAAEAISRPSSIVRRHDLNAIIYP